MRSLPAPSDLKLRLARVAVAICLFSGEVLFAADAPPAGAAPGGRGGRGGPLTAEDQAAIANLAELPAWKPGVGDGDYSIAPPYSPAPENARREGVPQGKVVTFHIDQTDSRFFPPVAGRDGRPPAPRAASGHVRLIDNRVLHPQPTAEDPR